MQKYGIFHKKLKAKFKILYIMYNTKESPLKNKEARHNGCGY